MAMGARVFCGVEGDGECEEGRTSMGGERRGDGSAGRAGRDR